MTIWRMLYTCWITKATNTHSEYVMFISFPLQQCSHKRDSMLRYSTLLDVLYSCRYPVFHLVSSFLAFGGLIPEGVLL